MGTYVETTTDMEFMNSLARQVDDNFVDFTAQYSEDAAVHLNNSDVYVILSEDEANLMTDVLYTDIVNWLVDYKRCIGDDAHDFIRQHLHDNAANPFGQFYILYKIHKGKKNGRWPTRPVCSDVSSLTHVD